MKKIPILAAIILLLISLTTAEEWMSFTTADGLAHDICRCVAVDHDGNVWVGHGDAFSGEGGVSMWDGETWTTYYSWTTDFGLRSNYINDIAVDQDNNIWFGTGTVRFGGGLTKFDGETWERCGLDTILLPEVFVENIIIDQDGAIHFLPICSYEYCIMDSSLTCYSRSDLHDMNIYDIFINGRIFLCGYGGFGYFEDGHFSPIHLEDNHFEEILVDSDTLWLVNRRNGIRKFHDSFFVYYDTSDGLIDNDVRCLHKDNSRLLVGTASGLCYLQSSEFVDLSSSPESPHTWILDIHKDVNNNILLASTEGFYVYNEHGVIWEIDEDRNKKNTHISCYPNPSNGCFYFSENESAKEIHNIKGELIRQIKKGVNVWYPDKDLPNGIYILTQKSEKCGQKTIISLIR